MPNFSNRLKELRLENSLTQQDIADILGSKLRVITYYEKGERVPPLDKLLILADYFQCSLDYLTGRSDIKEIDNPEIDKNVVIDYHPRVNPQQEEDDYEEETLLAGKNITEENKDSFEKNRELLREARRTGKGKIN